MDSCLITLGITLPFFDCPDQEKVGDIIGIEMFELTATSSSFQHDQPRRLSSGFHGKIHLEDDDTVSILSTSTSIYDSVTYFRQVTFAENLVTAVHYRPTTTREEKYHLHYNKHDYRDFKFEYMRLEWLLKITDPLAQRKRATKWIKSRNAGAKIDKIWRQDPFDIVLPIMLVKNEKRLPF
jgi:hypothetical protein